ncbi:MAG: hypothetical protein DI629_11855 [Mesorhizobium amorphae]|nr:MAG: hypothetical protein DI629_11855 [Mesorhizobium amorphae]
MADTVVGFAADGIEAALDTRFGMLAALRVTWQGQTAAPLHRAPWLDDAEPLPPGAAPHLAGLSGDFFCAPFGDASADGAPAHGWPANSAWDHLETLREGGETLARFRLRRSAMGAVLVKELRLVDGHPFLYQRHVFTGGQGTFAAANHAMVSLPHGGRLSFSPKRWWETPATALETNPTRGRSLLRYPARSDDPRHFPLQDGGEADLSRYPFGNAHEDFAAGIESEGSPLGWTAVAREGESDFFLSLRNPRRLPMTKLWFSNGGRDYAPWNGRHRGVLGVEEGLNRALLGWSANQTPHPLDAASVPTGLTLDPGGTVEMRHIIGALPWAGGAAGVEREASTLVVRDEGGGETRVPCDLGFLELS